MKRNEVPDGIRYITFSCQRRLPLLHNPAIYQLFVDSLARVRDRYGIAIYAWVIMPEHVHLLLKPDAEPLDRSLKSLKLSVAKRVIARWRAINAPILDKIMTSNGSPRFWMKGGGFDRNVRDISEFSREVRYIHRNPVERILVDSPEAWAWSSVRWWMGKREGELPCDPPPGDQGAWESWKGFL